MATTAKKRNNKTTRLILPALYDAGSAGLTINEVVDPRTGNPVEALYFYDAANPEKNDGKALIEQTSEPVRTGERGRPARRWKLTKSTRDRITKQRKRAQQSAEPVATPEPALV